MWSMRTRDREKEKSVSEMGCGMVCCRRVCLLTLTEMDNRLLTVKTPMSDNNVNPCSRRLGSRSASESFAIPSFSMVECMFKTSWGALKAIHVEFMMLIG